MKYIDIHCHLNLPDYDLDRDEVIKRAKDNDIGIILVGTNLESSKKVIKIAEENENIWAVIGLHPVEIGNEIGTGEFNYEEYKKLAQNLKVVGIGECGFDYYKLDHDTKALQQKIFEQQINLANEVNKPLMLHVRNGIKVSHNAYLDTIEIIKKHARVSGNVHFFAGSPEEAKGFLDLDFRLSFTGVITFVRNYDEVIKNTPLNMIMVETDSPYVTPVPYRGTRNEPSYIVEVARSVASIKGEPIEKILPILVDNAKRLFSI